MKKLMFIAAIIGSLAMTANASTNSLFSREVRFDTFASYTQGADVGAGIGATLFPFKTLGLTVYGTRNNLDNLDGTFVQSAAAALIFRVPVTDVFAPYVTAGVSYGLDTRDFYPYAGVGVEYKITKRFGIFAEGVYQFESFQKWDVSGWENIGVRGGIRFGLW